MKPLDDDMEHSLYRYFKKFDADYEDDAPSETAWKNIQKNIDSPVLKLNWKRKTLATVLVLFYFVKIGDLDFIKKTNSRLQIGGSEVGIANPDHQDKLLLNNPSEGSKPSEGLNSLRNNDSKGDNNRLQIGSSAVRIANAGHQDKLLLNNPSEGCKHSEGLNSLRNNALKGNNSRLQIGNATVGIVNPDQQKLLLSNPSEGSKPSEGLNSLRNPDQQEINNRLQIDSSTVGITNPDQRNPDQQNENLDYQKHKEYQPFHLAKNELVIQNNEQVFDLGPIKSKKYLSWTLAVQPFQTFQYLTNNISTTDFQLAALHVPALTSGQRTGWQVRLGAEGKRSERLSWRVSGFYRALPQFVNYQISTNQFLVKEVATNKVSVERITIDVNEQKIISFVGLQTDYLYRLKHGFFVSSGIEGSVDWNNLQNQQLGIIASAGWEHKISKNQSVVIEPTYRSNDTELLILQIIPID